MTKENTATGNTKEKNIEVMMMMITIIDLAEDMGMEKTNTKKERIRSI